MTTAFRFSELRSYAALGASLLWLKPNSKAPIDGKGWAQKEMPPFDEFKKAYRKGNNVGVRLGRKLADGFYLGALDVDVKSADPKHQAEAYAALANIFPEAEAAPRSMSGRGNGSCHVLIRTKEPLRGNERKAQSKEIVKVKMPSVEASGNDKKQLTPEEIAQGYRMRPAWEICRMSLGRQIVLPGSVHPDTGRHYAWAKGKALGVVPLPEWKEAASATLEQDFLDPKPLAASVPGARAPYEFPPVDVESLGLRAEQVAAITHGVGVTDRSASLFALAMALMQRGHSNDVILSVLTDTDNWISSAAYEHTKSRNRQRAAHWLYKYTLTKARAQVDAPSFEVTEVKPKAEQESLPIEIEEISGAGADAYAAADEWKKELDLQPGVKGAPPTIRATFKNLCLILGHTIGPDFLSRDVFAMREYWAKEVPWGCAAGQERSSGTQDEIRLKHFLIEVWGIEASVNMITETLAYFAGQNERHPVKEYLESLPEWDGVPRIDTAFEVYLGAKMPKVYLRAVCRKFFHAMIARIYHPGVKFDHLPVLEGNQGIGKSTFGRILVGTKWFMDGLPDLQDKDAALNLQGIWLCEMSELATLQRAQLEVAKAFITRQTDKIRPPYGARRVDFPRSTVFIGTTNDREYLSDLTGNRRFWPVFIEGCDFAALERDREQLLAEAFFEYHTCPEKLWLTGEALKQAIQIQESRRLEDDFDGMLFQFKKWVKSDPKHRTSSIKQIRIDALFDEQPFAGKFTKSMATRKLAALVLRREGYRKVHTEKGKLWLAPGIEPRKPGRPKGE